MIDHYKVQKRAAGSPSKENTVYLIWGLVRLPAGVQCSMRHQKTGIAGKRKYNAKNAWRERRNASGKQVSSGEKGNLSLFDGRPYLEQMRAMRKVKDPNIVI